ncbi:ComEA family DNA-binding protein [Chitinophaga qingshengii]|uniref:Helix-hairpin-helix domain-containing protein n=1 Tax=Chitinophaga qingshengii TaxID=1569794 RepID=A0ABR7TNC9_9BACT|nr:helix-hairpin-helix domain-containing protein [Chitinophaga qingshengii]MBC9931985.1 helix-hairpin-helix domain-containing protein [Chitinophaga qingshengii]
MVLKRICGLLAGFFIGAIPLVNCLAATLLAFYKKKKRVALFYAILTGVFVFALGKSYYADEKKKGFNPVFLQSFKQHLADQASLKQQTEAELGVLKFTVGEALCQAAMEQMEKDAALEGLLEAAKRNDFSGNARAEYAGFCQCLYEQYLLKVNTSKGKHRFDLKIDSAMINHCEPAMISFTDAYLESGNLSGYWLLQILIGLTYLLCWVGCVRNARNLFVPPPEPPVRDTSQLYYSDLFRSWASPLMPAGPPRAPLPQEAPPPPPPPMTPPPLPPMVKINIADEAELMQLRGVNRILAKSIIAERSAGGNFTDVNDLKKRMDLSREQIDGMSASLSFDALRGRGGRVIEY